MSPGPRIRRVASRTAVPDSDLITENDESLCAGFADTGMPGDGRGMVRFSRAERIGSRRYECPAGRVRSHDECPVEDRAALGEFLAGLDEGPGVHHWIRSRRPAHPL